MLARLLNALFFKHIFISFCAASFTATGYLLLGGEGGIGFTRLSFVFFSTLFIYHFNTAPGINLPNTIRDPSGLMKSNGKHNYQTIVPALIVLLHLFFIPLKEILLLGHLGILSLLYNPPDDLVHRRIPLRSIPFLKIFLITYIWSVLGAVYPWLILQTIHPPSQIIHLFAGLFFFILGITLPFDIRDYYKDRRALLPTMAHLLGMRATRAVSLTCILISTLLLLSFYSHPLFLLVPMAVAMVLILKANPENHPLFFLGMLDGTILLLYFVTRLSV